MKIAMIFPSRESEKAISGYSINLSTNIKNQGVDIEDITYTAGSPKSFFKIIPKLKKYDVIHIQHEYNLLGWFGIPFFFVYFFLGFLSKKTIVTSMHSVLAKNEKFPGSVLKTFLRKLLYRTQNKIIDKKSDSIIAHGSFFKKILVRDYGIKQEKISVFISGVPENIKTISKQKAKKKLKLSGPVYLVIGNLVPDHGLHKILKQAKKIGKTILVVLNPNPVNDRNKKRVQEYLKLNKDYVQKNNLQEVVRFDVSNITDKKPIWWEYFSAADFVLQAYRKGIASGIFIHAMATKTPVIASNNEFFKEISDDFGCLKIAKNEEDYSKVIKEAIKPKNYKKMQEECKRFLKEQGWSNVARKYKELYISLK